MTNYPKNGTEYWYLDADDPLIIRHTNFNDVFHTDRNNFDAGNFYLAKQEAGKVGDKIQSLLDLEFSAQKERLNKLIEEGKL